MGGWLGRRLLIGVLLTLAVSMTYAVEAAPASGATPGSADGHDYITITGEDLPAPLTVTALDQPVQHASLLNQVNWLVKRAGDAPEPDPETLGPGYTLLLHRDDAPRHEFALYPMAEGGPRVFRPASQPDDHKVTEAWFFGRLGMAEALQAAGVAMSDDETGGGAGGGAPVPTESAPTAAEEFGVADQWWQGLLLTLGLAAAMVVALASIAFLLRRDP